MAILPVGIGPQEGGYQIEQSLRFNSADSAYLNRTPWSAGNRKTWTWSGWVKRSGLGSLQALFSCGTNGVTYHDIYINSDDTLRFIADITSTPLKYTTQVLRDVGAFYHIVAVWDTSNATAGDRMRLYINGTRITAFGTSTDPALNADGLINSTSYPHAIGQRVFSGSNYYSGYMTEVHFIDGQALTPSSFGETDTVTGVWKPKAYTGSYGTNGFYLPMKVDQIVEGFNTVLWAGNSGTQRITGVGFKPDLVWTKVRNVADAHILVDSVRGDKALRSNSTIAEYTTGVSFTFDNDGFTNYGTTGELNYSTYNYVSWCWKAGNSTVSNTDGTITSSVRANPTLGFSIVTWTGTGTAGSIGHGLGTAPSAIITKKRSGGTADAWFSHFSAAGTGTFFKLNTTDAVGTNATIYPWNLTSSTFGVSNDKACNESGSTYVAYCFAETGYSKFGSYSGTGASGNAINVGFKPAFVMIKNTTLSGTSWEMFDSSRDTEGTNDKELLANSSSAEGTYTLGPFTDTGFTINASSNGVNASGSTYIYMAFKDTREAAFWQDKSGNSNNWQPNNLDFNDPMVDTPTPYGTDTGAGGEVRGNYCTWNPLQAVAVNAGAGVGAFNLSDGNLVSAEANSSNTCGYVCGTMAVSSGKWYWEVTCTSIGGSYGEIGIHKTSAPIVYSGTADADYRYRNDGTKQNGGTGSAYGSALSTGNIVGVALDLDAGTITFYRNGTSQGTAFTGLSGEFTPIVGDIQNSTANTYTANFGQRPFAYTAPSGFKALCTQNLPEPTIKKGSAQMNTVLWNGAAGGTNLNVTGFGFQPDFIWSKNRNDTYSHYLQDAVRGITNGLTSNSTAAESTTSGSPTSFISDGFNISSTSGWSSLGNTEVTWAWKANGAGVSNTAGTITSTVSANTTSGFSIVSYTGTGSNATIGHGLGVAPSMIIVKNRGTTTDWAVYHKNLTSAAYWLELNSTGGQSGPNSVVFNSTAPTSTVFSVGTNDRTNATNSYVAYCFAPVAGFSAFGSYTGNGSADGVFVFLGFRPRFVLVKKYTAAESWQIADSARASYNVSQAGLSPNSSAAENTTAGNRIDLLSNGFKARDTAGQFNDSGQSYIYAAFAENPFKYSLAR